MSVHRSLKVKEGLLRARNVWKRGERLDALKKAGKLAADGSVYGLPKVRTAMKTKKAKSDKPAKAAAKPGAPAAPAAAASAAAGAKGPAKAAPAGKPAKK